MKKVNLTGPFVYSTNQDLMKAGLAEEAETPPPSLQKLKIKTDTKHRAGKMVTLIEGFKGRESDAVQLGKLLKTKCGTGGSVKDHIILLQGDYKNKVIQILQQLQYQVS